MSPGFHDWSESDKAVRNVEGPRGKLREQAQGEGIPANMVTVCGYEGEHLCLSAAYCPCMSTTSSRASSRVTKILLSVTKHCLVVFLMKPSFCMFCLLYLHSPKRYYHTSKWEVIKGSITLAQHTTRTLLHSETQWVIIFLKCTVFSASHSLSYVVRYTSFIDQNSMHLCRHGKPTIKLKSWSHLHIII